MTQEAKHRRGMEGPVQARSGADRESRQWRVSATMRRDGEPFGAQTGGGQTAKKTL